MSIISGHAEATPTGLSLGDGLSYADWEAVGFELAKVGKAIQWWIGDWVNYGGKRYGETYKAAIDATGMSYGTVQRFALLCQSFEMGRRRHILSFNHHVEVWSLEPSQQDELLDRAEAEGLSCAKLREIVRSMNAIESDEVEPDEAVDDELVDDSETAGDTEDWADICVQAFTKAESRLEVLRSIIATLEPYEAATVRDWIVERLH